MLHGSTHRNARPTDRPTGGNPSESSLVLKIEAQDKKNIACLLVSSDGYLPRAWMHLSLSLSEHCLIDFEKLEMYSSVLFYCPECV